MFPRYEALPPKAEEGGSNAPNPETRPSLSCICYTRGNFLEGKGLVSYPDTALRRGKRSADYRGVRQTQLRSYILRVRVQ